MYAYLYVTLQRYRIEIVVQVREDVYVCKCTERRGLKLRYHGNTTTVPVSDVLCRGAAREEMVSCRRSAPVLSPPSARRPQPFYHHIVSFAQIKTYLPTRG